MLNVVKKGRFLFPLIPAWNRPKTACKNLHLIDPADVDCDFLGLVRWVMILPKQKLMMDPRKVLEGAESRLEVSEDVEVAKMDS